jgi:exosome complex RNA-binding protein Rrp42 (RNase PH superfamily)
MTFIKGVNCDLKLFITKLVDMNACVLIKVNLLNFFSLSECFGLKMATVHLDVLLISISSNVISKYVLTSNSVTAVLFK